MSAIDLKITSIETESQIEVLTVEEAASKRAPGWGGYV